MYYGILSLYLQVISYASCLLAIIDSRDISRLWLLCMASYAEYNDFWRLAQTLISDEAQKISQSITVQVCLICLSRLQERSTIAIHQ